VEMYDKCMDHDGPPVDADGASVAMLGEGDYASTPPDTERADVSLLHNSKLRKRPPRDFELLNGARPLRAHRLPSALDTLPRVALSDIYDLQLQGPPNRDATNIRLSVPPRSVPDYGSLFAATRVVLFGRQHQLQICIHLSS